MNIFSTVPNCRRHPSCRRQRLLPASAFAVLCGLILAANAGAQIDSASPAVVQPAAPGKPSRKLPASTTARLPPRSQAEADFMRGMIMHHAQAIDMTALISSHTANKDLRFLGARISSSQADEINFMKRWLATRGEPVAMKMAMPGMLTAEQMEALRKAKDADFDRLFLIGMIQPHNGALTMVRVLFDTAGGGQDAELFDFANDADNTQRAEIGIMRKMLDPKNPEEKQ